MRYLFDDFVVDTATRSLHRAGAPVTLARRAFECLVHLLINRERAVARDELIDVLWHRGDVSYNQLAQLVLGVRHALGDSGSSQRMIRTVAGFGYHWVMPVVEEPVREDGIAGESEPEVATPAIQPGKPLVGSEPAVIAAAPAASNASRQRLPDTRASAWVALAVLLVLSLWALGWRAFVAEPPELAKEPPADAAEARAPASTPAAVAAALLELQVSMRRGRYEETRAGLARLPAELAATPQARLLAIDLHLARGQWSLAERRLQEDLASALAVGDRAREALLLTRRAQLLLRTAAPADALRAVADAALDAFNAAAEQSDPGPALAGEVWRARGRIGLATGELEQALLDLGHARDRFLEAGDSLAAAMTASSMARVWMRQGRLTEALDQMQDNVFVFAEGGDVVHELGGLNTVTRLQLELLAWEDALLSSDRALALLSSAAQSERGSRTRQIRAWVLLGLGLLREAESQIEDIEAEQRSEEPLLRAALALLGERPQTAITAADQAFRDSIVTDPQDVLYENREGALLLRLIAMQALHAAGEPVPALAPEHLQVLGAPETGTGQIALGRWHWLSGNPAAAKEALRGALQEARQMNRSQRMRLAGEALIDLHLQQDEVETAARVLAELRSHDPERFDRDYLTNLLAVRVFAATAQAGGLATSCARASELRGDRALPQTVIELCSAP
jgi:DNA-binding winged helix-turn-helix (wHTH) protein/tetratricopeptide (TPR) repeat protein